VIAATLSGLTAAEAPDIILATRRHRLIISAAVAAHRRFAAVPVSSEAAAADISPVRAAVSAADFGAGRPAVAVLSTDAR
jgi:hypothetical protein